jgi:MinD-like ATPase involved in chromosome partitioning or flagellar assembly
MSKNSKTLKPRVIVILGGKGGVGKTLFAASLADFYSEKQVGYVAIDADAGNSKHGSLAYLLGCQKLDIRGRIGLDALIDHALSGPEVVLVDFGAGTVEELAKWIGEVGGALSEENVSLTIAALITGELATVDALLRCAERVTDKATYVLIENRVRGDAEDALNSQELRQFIEVAQPSHIKIELLRSDLAQELDKVGQSPRAANVEPKSELLRKSSARIRLSAWRTDINNQIIQTNSLLPL